jgi:DNA repair protein RadC
MTSWDRERFLTLLLDGRHKVLGLEEVSVGTATASLVHPREVFKGIILANAVAFILVHYVPRNIMSLMLPLRLCAAVRAW